MSKMTERLVQAACAMLIIWFGWSLAKETIVSIIEANNRAAAAEQRLQSILGKQGP